MNKYDYELTYSRVDILICIDIPVSHCFGVSLESEPAVVGALDVCYCITF